MESDVREDLAAGRLVRVLEDWTPCLAPLSLYYYNRRNSSAAFQAFIALVRDFTAGRLGEYTVAADKTVVLGDPTKFNKDNIDQFKF